MNYFSPEFFLRRREEVDASEDLQALRARLDAQLGPLRDREVWLPGEKPLLSQEGGVCPKDGARLEFRPLSPDTHWCPMCGDANKGKLHDRAWSWRYHIWLSERAIHAALLYRLNGNTDGLELGSEIINAYTAAYTSYPNQDNVLGPSRLFFSTYLESIWLTQIIVAASLIQTTETRDRGTLDVDRVEGMVAESAQIIASFDEAFSNRQVWNNVSLAAAGLYLEDQGLSAHAVNGPHGLRSALNTVVSDDGRWIEGENYHFFALQGFQLAAELLSETDLDLWAGSSGQKLGRMFTAPLDTLLPDLTFPARGDSPFGVSVAQPRFAQLWEIGRARTGSNRLSGILNSIYSHPEDSPDCGFEEISEVETHRPGGRVSRSGLGWKMLAWGNPVLSRTHHEWAGQSGVVGKKGPIVVRPDPDRYIMVETGTGAGHGHPDALHLTIFDGSPWLLDPGTASYVSPSLFWYRSTLAHNAPGVPGIGQFRAMAACTAFAVDGDVTFVEASAPGLGGPGVDVIRRLVVMPEYVLDLVIVRGPPGRVIDVPYHPVGSMPSISGNGNSITEQGVGYASIESLQLVSGQINSVAVHGPETEWEISFGEEANAQLLTADAPGPPTLSFADGSLRPILIRRLTGPGQLAAAYARKGRVIALENDGEALQIIGKSTSDSIRFFDGGVEVNRHGQPLKRLRGPRAAPVVTVRKPDPVPHIWGPMISKAVGPRDWVDHIPWNAIHPLKEPHYRRSEAEYPGEHAFMARIATWVRRSELLFAVDVEKDDTVFFDPDHAPRLDNEPPEIHADGIQCYWSTPAEIDTWHGLVATVTRDGVHLQSVSAPATDLTSVRASVAVRSGGYRLMIQVDTGQPVRPRDKYRFNIVINEMRPGRQRRAGQLAFVGGGGWVYLRGDREPIQTAAVVEVE